MSDTKTYRFRLQPGTYQSKYEDGGSITVWQKTLVQGRYQEYSGEGVQPLGAVETDSNHEDPQEP